MRHEETEVPGLSRMRRDVAPPHDLWPGIEARIRNRRSRASVRPWAGFALAASLLLAIAVPLRQQAPQTPTAGPKVLGQGAAYFAAQFRELEGAQQELLLALELRPQSPGLRRLLESTRERQRDLRRLALKHV